MPNIAALSKLFKAVSTRNWDEASAYAARLAEEEEARGNHRAALQLRTALKANGKLSTSHGEVLEPGAAVGILTQVPANETLEEVALRPANRSQMEALIAEWASIETLRAHGVRRRSKILFHGPPGCGKSMAARALATGAQLPAHVVQLDALMGAFLGQTALRVREVFRFAETVPSVLILDEVDAVGRTRGNAMDVGELDRVVIAVMQRLEHSEPAGFLIATSNLHGRLDPALVRRFDMVLEFPAPNKTERTRFAAQRAKTYGLPITKALRAELGRCKAFAEIERVLGDERRRRLVKPRKLGNTARRG